MSAIIDKLAHELAQDAIDAAEAMGDEELIMDIAKLLASSSTTAEEAFLTAARVRMALVRARKMLDARIDAAAAKIDGNDS